MSLLEGLTSIEEELARSFFPPVVQLVELLRLRRVEGVEVRNGSLGCPESGSGSSFMLRSARAMLCRRLEESTYAWS